MTDTDLPGQRRLARKIHNPLGAVVLLAAILLPAIGAAQVPDGVERTLSNQSDLLKRVRPVPKRGQIEINVVDERRLVPRDQAQKVTFILHSLSVDGAVTLSERQLQKSWQPLLGKTISLADLYGVADAIEKIYRDSGYFSAVVVPSQNFDSGNITLKLYETGFDEITIESDIPNIEARLAPYINRLLALQPVPVAEVERILLLMSDLAGLDIEGVATRPQQPGAGGRMHLKISRTALTSQVGLDNFGSDEIGPLETTATLSLNDQLGLFENSTLAGVTIPNQPTELRLVQFSQDYPIGTNGLHAGYNLAYVASRPGGDLRSSGIDVQTVSGALFARYPFIRRITHSLFGEANLNFDNSDVDIDNSPATRDRLRWITTSLSYDQDLDKGFFNLKATGGMGIDGLGQTPSKGALSSRDGVPDHYKFWRLGATFQHALWEDASVALKGGYQYSPDPLPTAVQIDYGGPEYGPAFDSASARGDSGYTAAIVVSQNFDSGTDIFQNSAAFAFADYGLMRNHNVSIDYERLELGSWGAGLRTRVGKHVQARVLLAAPWKKDDNVKDHGTRLLFRLVASF